MSMQPDLSSIVFHILIVDCAISTSLAISSSDFTTFKMGTSKTRNRARGRKMAFNWNLRLRHRQNILNQEEWLCRFDHAKLTFSYSTRKASRLSELHVIEYDGATARPFVYCQIVDETILVEDL